MDQRDYRDAIGRFPTGVAVATARDADGELKATTINALTSVSLDPPTLLICLKLQSFTLEAVRSSERFAINILAEDHRMLSDHFAVRGNPTDTFDTWIDEEHPTPLVENAVAHLECSVSNIVESGDHAIVLGEVIACATDEGEASPLAFLGGSYARIDHAEPAATLIRRSNGPLGLDDLDAERPRVTIVGGGAAGAMTAASLLGEASADLPLEVVMVERAERFGPGAAYATDHPGHRLNVPAGLMSAVPNAPSHFLDWLRRREPDATADDFAGRTDFGDYLEDVLADAELGSPHGHLVRVRAEAVELAHVSGERSAVDVALDTGARVRSDRVVLAIGNRSAEPRFEVDPELEDDERYIHDPWERGAVAAACQTESVLLVGAGLTMVDVVIGLTSGRGRSPVIHSVSRSALLPRGHREDGPIEHDFELGDAPATLKELLPRVFGELQAVSRRGGDWRDVVDSLRPHTTRIWRELPSADREWFVTHLRRPFEINRHRMAPEVAARITELQNAGSVLLTPGSVARLEPEGSRIRAHIRRADDDRGESMLVDRVINCAGRSEDITKLDDELVRSLLETGQVRPDPLRLGLDLADGGIPIGADGRAAEVVSVVGPLRRSLEWEAIAIPEIRDHTAVEARRLAAELAETRPVGTREVRA